MRNALVACLVASLAFALCACGEKDNKTALERLAEKAAKAAQAKARAAGTESTAPSGRKTEFTVKGDKGNVKVKVEGGKVTVKEEGGGEAEYSVGGGTKVPADFPKDVPLYKGATVVASVKQGKNFLVHLQTADEPKKAAAACKTAIEASGWTAEVAMDTPNGTVHTFKKDNRTCTVVVSKQGEDKTLIQITAATEE
jgi:major membrane immunogen (membrane-anchored lipoprotein)